ncbi:hypothetical protein BJ165DRAFT_1467767 [Panaeolus papilionaceus]|nr:hypothetical protein BJ165DRAFT_1467767 [Panaeolus papilionaceus]
MKLQTFAFAFAFIASVTTSAIAVPSPILCPQFCTRAELDCASTGCASCCGPITIGS